MITKDRVVELINKSPADEVELFFQGHICTFETLAWDKIRGWHMVNIHTDRIQLSDLSEEPDTFYDYLHRNIELGDNQKTYIELHKEQLKKITVPDKELNQ